MNISKFTGRMFHICYQTKDMVSFHILQGKLKLAILNNSAQTNTYEGREVLDLRLIFLMRLDLLIPDSPVVANPFCNDDKNYEG